MPLDQGASDASTHTRTAAPLEQDGRQTHAFATSLEPLEHVTAVIGEQGPCEDARRRARERRQRNGVPAWFSAEDLIAAPKT